MPKPAPEISAKFPERLGEAINVIRKRMKKINIGIIGFGTIGAGVVKALKERRNFLREKSGIDVNIVNICDKD